MPKKEFTKSQKKTIDKIYRTLSQAGYDDFAIAGILGNALTESGFDPDIISKNKSYHGLWQNGSNIRKAIEQQYGDHSLDSQLKYLLDWGNKAKWVANNAYTTTNAGRYKKAGYGSASDAGDAFMRLYERPVIMENGKVVGYQARNERLANSDLMYNYINSTYGKPEPVVTMTDTDKRMVFPKGYWDIPKQPIAEQQPIQTPLAPVQPKITTVAERAQNQDQIWQDFNQGAVAVGHKSILPKLSDMLDEGKTAYMRDALGLPNLWESQGYSYTPMQMQPRSYRDGKLPRYRYGLGGLLEKYDQFVEDDPYYAATALSYLPFIGTAMDIREAVKNPTAENIGYTALSGLTDLVGGRIFSKIAGKTIKSRKAANAARKAEYEYWKNTPFIQSMPKKQGKRTLKFYADRAADKAREQIIDDPTFQIDGFNIAAGLGAYAPDFVANTSQHKK